MNVSAIELKLLGGCEIVWQCRRGKSAPIASKKARALLVYLALNAGQVCLRDKLATLLWADKSDTQARHNLRQALATLRKLLPQADRVFAVDSESVSIRKQYVRTDIDDFEQLAASQRIENLERAAGLYRGEFLEGLNPRASVFEDWLMAQRSHVRERMQSILSALCAHYEAAGNYERALQYALRLLSLDPLNEAVHRSLMHLYLRLGKKNLALKQYRICSDILYRELNIEPEIETRHLHQNILRSRQHGSESARCARLALADVA